MRAAENIDDLPFPAIGAWHGSIKGRLQSLLVPMHKVLELGADVDSFEAWVWSKTATEVASTMNEIAEWVCLEDQFVV